MSGKPVQGEFRDAKKEVADRIIAEIEKGTLPWKREWNPDKCIGPQAPFQSRHQTCLSRHQCRDPWHEHAGVSDG